ncbi:MAG: YjbH domain-containing protein [Selenomonadaceae bacterium]
MKKQILSLILCSLCTASNVFAAPTMQGTTGNIDTPSADVLRPGQYHLGWYHLNEENTVVFGANLMRRIEMSVRQQKKQDKKNVQVNLKYALREEGVFTPGLAVGIDDIGDVRDRSVYVVTSKGLPWGVRVHAGVGSGRYDGAFAAVEKRLMPKTAVGRFPDTSVFIERIDHKMNYGLRVSLSPGFKADVGLRDGKSFVGLTYNYY